MKKITALLIISALISTSFLSMIVSADDAPTMYYGYGQKYGNNEEYTVGDDQGNRIDQGYEGNETDKNGTRFDIRVEYTDINNDVADYVRFYLIKTEDDGSLTKKGPYPMELLYEDRQRPTSIGVRYTSSKNQSGGEYPEYFYFDPAQGLDGKKGSEGRKYYHYFETKNVYSNVIYWPGETEVQQGKAVNLTIGGENIIAFVGPYIHKKNNAPTMSHDMDIASENYIINPQNGDYGPFSAKGTNSTIFTFKINVTDADNESTQNTVNAYVKIVFWSETMGRDGQGAMVPVDMWEMDANDTDITDGKWYTWRGSWDDLKANNSENGTWSWGVGVYEYFFRASDGQDTQEYGTRGTKIYLGEGERFKNITIVKPNEAPTLSNPIIQSQNLEWNGTFLSWIGYENYEFWFYIIYTDTDGGPAKDVISYIRITIKDAFNFGGNNLPGYPKDLDLKNDIVGGNPDAPVQNGVTYVHIKNLTQGDYSIRFEAKDNATMGDHKTAVSNVVNLKVLKAVKPVILEDASLEPDWGFVGTSFTYKVKYRQEENKAPSKVYVYIDGQMYGMAKEGSGTNYVSGEYYTYTTQVGLKTGENISNYNYNFSAYYDYTDELSRQTKIWGMTSLTTGPTVERQNEPISIISSTPTGKEQTIIETASIDFSITVDNPYSPPGENLVYTWFVNTDEVVNGNQFKFQTDYDEDATNKIYDEGTYTIKVNVSEVQTDQKYTSYYLEESWTVIVNKNNRPPIANISKPVKTNGNDPTYTILDNIQFDAAGSRDPDGDAITYEWKLDNITEVFSTEPTFSKKIEVPGTHTITLTVKDSEGAISQPDTVIVIINPKPNTAPELKDGKVDKKTGKEGESFTFEVTYSDADGNAGTVIVYIKSSDGITTYSPTMTYKSGNYTDGAIYSVSVFLNKTGSYTFWFEASDGKGGTKKLENPSYTINVEKGGGVIENETTTTENNMIYVFIAIGIVIALIGVGLALKMKKGGKGEEEEGGEEEIRTEEEAK